jgi:hypothetical protein
VWLSIHGASAAVALAKTRLVAADVGRPGCRSPNDVVFAQASADLDVGADPGSNADEPWNPPSSTVPGGIDEDPDLTHEFADPDAARTA